MVSIPATFGELAERVFEMLHKVLRIGFVTGSYRPLAIKEIERSLQLLIWSVGHRRMFP